MTFTSVFVAGLLQKPTSRITIPKEAKEPTGGGLSRNHGPAPSYYQIAWVHFSAKPARNRCPALPVECARPWHRHNGDNHCCVDDTTAGSGNMFAAPVLAETIRRRPPHSGDPMSDHVEPITFVAGPKRIWPYVRQAAAFIAPLVVLLLAWPVIVTLFDVNPRVFPSVQAVLSAAVDGLRDGTLVAHVAASLGRVALGTVLAVAVAVPLGVAMGVNAGVWALLTPLVPVLLSSCWNRPDSNCNTLVWVRIWRDHICHLQRCFLYCRIQYPPRRISDPALTAPRGGFAWRWATRYADGGSSPRGSSQYSDRRSLWLGFAWRGLIAAEMIATDVGLGYMLFVARDFYRTEVIVLGMIIIGIIWLLIDRLLLAPLERATIERWGLGTAHMSLIGQASGSRRPLGSALAIPRGSRALPSDRGTLVGRGSSRRPPAGLFPRPLGSGERLRRPYL